MILMCGWDAPRTQVVDAFKKLGERLVASIAGEQDLDSNQLRSHYQALIQAYLKQREPKSWDGFDEALKKQFESTGRQLTESLSLRVDQCVEQEKCRFEKLTWHVDVESGLVLRYEKCRRPSDVVNGFTTFEHFQMLES